MKRILRSVTIKVVLLGTWIGILVGAQAPQVDTAFCDRACLIKFVDTYLTALAARDPARAAIARNAKYTENAKTTPVGDGLWKNILEVSTTFRIYVADPVAGQVGFLGVIKQNLPLVPSLPATTVPTFPVVFALRLKVQDRQITEVEHIVARTAIGVNPMCDAEEKLPEDLKAKCRDLPMTAANLKTPRLGLQATVPVAERLPRDQMLRIANTYYDSIVQSVGDVAPYSDDCVRRENGLPTTSNSPEQALAVAALMARGNADWAKIFALGCRDQVNTRALSYITSIDNRRVQIADTETGLVFGLSMFRRPYQERSIKIVGVPGLETMNLDGTPSDRAWAHVFKIRGGQLHEIEAMGGLDLPLNSVSGWDGQTNIGER